MPESTKGDTGNVLKEVSKYGIPATTIIGLVIVLQFLGVPFGQEASKREADLAVKFERIESKLTSMEGEIAGLRAEVRAQGNAYITQGQFQVWIYRLQAQNQNSNLNIPHLQ